MTRTSTGRIAPTAMNADLSPSTLMTAGAANEPIAAVPIARPHVTPSTRVSTSSGTVRWSSVNPETSTTLFAAPTTASRTITGAKYGSGAISMIGMPQKTRAQANGGTSRSPRSETRRVRRPGPRLRSRPPGSRPPWRPCEHLVGGDDDQHVQAPAHECLRGDEAHEEPRARNLPDRLEPLQDLDARATRSRREAARDGHEREQCRRDDQRRCARREHRRDIGERDQDAGGEWAEQRAETLDRRGRSVRSDQLPGRARERWEQRDESRPEQRRADADRRPGREDDDPVVHQRSRGRDDERGRSERDDSQQEPLAPEAIAEGRCERRDRGRREQACEAGDPDRRGSAVAVGEHAEGDEVRPFGDDGRAPGQARCAGYRRSQPRLGGR